MTDRRTYERAKFSDKVSGNIGLNEGNASKNANTFNLSRIG